MAFVRGRGKGRGGRVQLDTGRGGHAAVSPQHFDVGLRGASQLDHREANLGRSVGPLDDFDRQGQAADAEPGDAALFTEDLSVEDQRAADRDLGEGDFDRLGGVGQGRGQAVGREVLRHRV